MAPRNSQHTATSVALLSGAMPIVGAVACFRRSSHERDINVSKTKGLWLRWFAQADQDFYALVQSTSTLVNITTLTAGWTLQEANQSGNVESEKCTSATLGWAKSAFLDNGKGAKVENR